MKYIFICREHEDFGTLGWALKGCDGMDPLGGMAVAHDCLEHFPTKHGQRDGVAEEFMALGAALWIRGETGYFQWEGNVNPPHVHLASDFRDIFFHIVFEQYYFRPCPPTRKLDADTEETLRLVQEEVANNLKEEENLLEEMEPDWIPNALAWMRRGYRLARRRFPDNYATADLFDTISKEADRALKHAEEYMELHVSIHKGNANVELRYSEEY